MINKSISVFFPCYNDSASIVKLVEQSFKILKTLTRRYEVIVINDASTDDSYTRLLKLTKKHPKLKLINHQTNLGYGVTLSDGFKAARYQLVFYTDGDGQYDVRELPLLVSLMSRDINFVNGIKLARQDPTYRIVIGNLYSFAARWLFWLPVFDVDCDFRLVDRRLIKQLHLTSTSGSVCIELVKQAQRRGAHFRQVSVHHYQRAHGQSQFFQANHLAKTLIELISLWYRLMIADKIHHFSRRLVVAKTSLHKPSVVDL